VSDHEWFAQTVHGEPGFVIDGAVGQIDLEVWPAMVRSLLTKGMCDLGQVDGIAGVDDDERALDLLTWNRHAAT
jgi:hypothetical protein